MEGKKYMTSGAAYSEQQAPNRSNWLRVDMYAFPHDNICTGSHNLEIKLYAYENDNQEIFFQGSLSELIELILLGKSHKAQLQAMGKKEPVVPWVSALPHPQKDIKVCDLCGKPTTRQNPHYDCEQREAYLANNLREVLDNG